MRSHAKAVVAVLAMLLTLALGASAASADAPPTVTIEPASEVGVSGAKLKGTVDPEGGPSTAYWRFEVAPIGNPEAWNYVGGGELNPPDSEGTDPVAVQVNAEGLVPETEYRFRIVAENESSPGQYNVVEAIEPTTFTTGSTTAPTLTIDPASPIGYTTAHLSGTIDPEGGNENPATGPTPIYWYLQYSKDPVNESWSTGVEGVIEGAQAEGDDPIVVQGDIAPGTLQPDTAYEFQIFAFYASFQGQTSVEGPGFQTLAVDKPIVTLDPVTAFGAETATFEGEVDPDAPEAAPTSDDVAAAYATSYRFECIPACPNTPGPQTIPADNQPHSVSFEAEGLDPGTTYEVRLIASNLGGEEVQSRSFKTASAPPTMAVATVGALTHDSARLTAYVDANSSPTTVTFEYDTDAGFSSPSTAPAGEGTTVTGNGNKIAFADISGLAPETTYYWRVGVQSAEGSDAATAERAFTTWAPEGPDQGGVGVEGRREIELVSDPKVPQQALGATIAPSGDRVLYSVWGGTDETSFGQIGTLFADRTANGWATSNAMPPAAALGSEDALMIASSPDLTRFALVARRHLVANQYPAPLRYYRWTPATGELTAGASLTSAGAYGPHAFTNPDASQLIRTYRPTPTAVSRLYDVLPAGGPVELGLMPDGSSPACGVSLYEANGGEEGSNGSMNQISADGQRFFFHSQGDDCDDIRDLYMREGGAGGSTKLISGPLVSPPERSSRFLQASPDGSTVFYTTAARLDPADGNSGADIYRHTEGKGNECITCLVPDAQVASTGNPADPTLALVAETGDRAYFLSSRVLTSAAQGVEGDKLYVWRDGEPDEIEFVAPAPDDFRTSGSFQKAIATPDGSSLVFFSERSEMDSLTASSRSQRGEYYRYDDRSGELGCISCAEHSFGEGPAVSIVKPAGLAIERKSQLTLDGRTFFFETNRVLVDADINEGSDVYEWRDGHLGLITDGIYPATGNNRKANVYSATPDGSSMMFTAAAALTPGVTPGVGRLYVARVGGGFPQVQPPAPCGGEGCRGPLPAPPPDPGASTPGFLGPGDPQPKVCAKGKVRKRGSCVKKKARKAAKQRSKNAKNTKNAKRAGAEAGGSK